MLTLSLKTFQYAKYSAFFQGFWMGGRRGPGGGLYDIFWVSTGDKVGATFSKWYDDNPVEIPNCVISFPIGEWAMCDCSLGYYFICEFE